MKKHKSLQRLAACDGEKRAKRPKSLKSWQIWIFFEVKLKISEFSCQGARPCTNIFLLKLRDFWIMIYLTSLPQGFVPKNSTKKKGFIKGWLDIWTSMFCRR